MPEHRPLLGRQEYIAALDQLISQGSKTLRIFDYNLEGGGYESLSRTESLKRFLAASPSNQLFLVVHDVTYLTRNCPRLLELLKYYGHGFVVHETTDEAKGIYDPFAIADESHYVHRFHYRQDRAELALDDDVGTHGLIKRFEELWQASTPAVPISSLGL